MKEHYVSMDQAKRLHELGFDGVDKYYVTESFCYGGNPDDYYQEGQLVDEYIVYFTNENNEDDYRGVPAPRLDQAAAWMRDCKKIFVGVNCENFPDAYLSDMEPCYFPRIINLPGCSVKSKYWNDNLYTDEPNWFTTYEEALSAGIGKALELLGREVKE